jgi:hypothetical protein
MDPRDFEPPGVDADDPNTTALLDLSRPDARAIRHRSGVSKSG